MTKYKIAMLQHSCNHDPDIDAPVIFQEIYHDYNDVRKIVGALNNGL
ncbi:MAG: hypothetical protein HPY87_10100 [Fervidobacterium sp.]|nr:hypothetical protein [Fervidobacterium sp.]NPU90211.1 hypothetical protein [Fervidobacterium sp.]